MGMSGGMSSIGSYFGGQSPFNFFQPARDPRAAPSPYSHTPWGGGYFNDAARSGATAESSPYTYPNPALGGGGGYMGFGGGFGGYNPFANPFASAPMFNRYQPPYMGAPPTPTPTAQPAPTAPTGGGGSPAPMATPPMMYRGYPMAGRQSFARF